MDKNDTDENKQKIVKNKNFGVAISHSIDGIIRAFKTERNLRIDYFIAILVLLASIILGFERIEFVCLCLTIGFVIFAEMMNSVCEYIVDLVVEKYDDRAKAAKDIAAGGVLTSASISVIVAYFLFSDKLTKATTEIFASIINSKSHILFTIIFILVIMIIILKGIFGRGEDYAHSGPSLKVAMAFALTTYSIIITKNILVGAICAFLSIMILGMKATNTKARTINMIYSALLGILLVVIVYEFVLIGPAILSKFSF